MKKKGALEAPFVKKLRIWGRSSAPVPQHQKILQQFCVLFFVSFCILIGADEPPRKPLRLYPGILPRFWQLSPGNYIVPLCFFYQLSFWSRGSLVAMDSFASFPPSKSLISGVLPRLMSCTLLRKFVIEFMFSYY